jgi:tetratricopeptide (TPR) repeat protein
MSSIKVVLSVLAITFYANLLSAKDTILPPDSTTSIVDKTASTYMIEEGKTLYNDGKIKDALIKFRQATVKDPNSWKAAYWVGKCHYQLDNFGYALKYANTAISLGDDKVADEIYFLLGTTYHRLGNLDSALINYSKSLELLSKPRAKVLLVDNYIAECKFADSIIKSGKVHERKLLDGDVNSGYDDYGVVLSNDGMTMYFTSRRSNTTGGGMNPDDQRYFEDAYVSKYNKEEGKWEDATNELGRLNSEGFDALNFLSPDGLTAVMTLNSTYSEAKSTTKGSDLCELKLSNKDTWNSPKIIKNKSINTSYFEGSASLTADGNTMYFVSDRKGEKSSTDIYVVEKDGKKWGEAKPLPMNVNTTGRETTPFITQDGRFLFFSSDGHIGMGGLDIYVSENLGDSWGDPINLGYGINTVNNDSHFVYSKELNKGFVSGYEIIGNKASIDIYEVDLSNFSLPLK